MFRQHIGKHAFDAGLFGDRLGGALIIAGDHRHLNAHFMQLLHYINGVGFDGIR